MITQLYHKLIGKRLFIKIILIYTFIIVLVLMALTSVFLQNYISTVNIRAINHCSQTVQKANEYLSQKLSYAKQIQQLPYYREAVYGNVLQFMEEDYGMYSPNYIFHKNTLDQYFSYIGDLDPSISIVHAYLRKANICYSYIPNNGKTVSEKVNNLNPKVISNPSIKKSFSPLIIPTNTLFLEPPATLSRSHITLAANLRSPDLSKIIGTIFLTFDLHNLEGLLSQEHQEFESSLMLFDLNGHILYNPSNNNLNFKTLKNAQSDLLMIDSRIISLHTNTDLGIITACIIKNPKALASVKLTKRLIYLMMFICISVAFLLSAFCMSFFSKRIHTVCTAMAQVKSGNFSNHLKISKNNDEIDCIATHFNYMCDSLDDYMTKVYQLGMRQKDAELKQKIAEYCALQSQINPHFLFNTLEAIRMSAVSSGNKDLADMIYKLGTLFRGSISQGMFIGVRNELDYCKSYLELLQLRYGESLTSDFDIDDRLYRYGIIKHLLQPLVENAVIHGLDPEKPENHIQIKGHLHENKMIDISITDNGIGISRDILTKLNESLTHHSSLNDTHIGIINVQQRIKLIYGDPFGLTIDSLEGMGTTIHIKIPAKTVKELEHYVQSYVS